MNGGKKSKSNLKGYTSGIHNKGQLRRRAGSSDSDCERKNIELVFAEGESSKQVSIATYRDAFNEYVAKQLTVYIEYKEGVSASIGRKLCRLSIYDTVVADAYFSYALIEGYEQLSRVKDLASGQSLKVKIAAYSGANVPKTDGSDFFFALLQSGTTNLVFGPVTRIVAANYLSPVGLSIAFLTHATNGLIVCISKSIRAPSCTSVITVM